MRGDEPGGHIRWRMHIPVSREEVFAVPDADEGRASFWAESATVADGYLDFRFIDGYRYRGEVLERDPPRLLSFEYFGGHARFELAEDGAGGTNLLLTHEGVGPHEWQEVHAGWLNVLFPLKAYLAHGMDLRNHDPERLGDRGYADQ